MRVVGMGICGANERYLENTLKEFKRLCDDVVLVANNIDKDSRTLIEKYGFKLVEDNRVWGEHQHHIKQDLVDNHISKLNPDWVVSLDMDEVFDETFTRESIKELEKIGDAFYFYIVNLWNNGWKRKWSFWNIRLWRWNGMTKFVNRPLHCGLAPEWAYHYGSYAPYILWHYGLKDKDKRDSKVERYRKFDPKAIYRDKSYYEALEEDSCDELKKEVIRGIITKEVESYKQSKKQIEIKKPMKYFYVKNPQGSVIDVPEKDLDETLAREGFALVGEVVVNRSKEVPVIEPPVVEEEVAPETVPVVKEEVKTKKRVTKKAK